MNYRSMRISPKKEKESPAGGFSRTQKATRQAHHQLQDSPSSPSAIDNDEVILIEDFDEQKDTEFLNDVTLPYFQTLFQDLAMRRHQPKKSDDELDFIDKVAFFEYV